MNLFSIQTCALGAALSVAVSGVSVGQDGQFHPEPFEPARYTESFTASPFEREIFKKSERPEIATEPFGLMIVGATGNDGSYRVVVVDRGGRYQVITAKPNAKGFYYAGIRPSKSIQNFEAQIARDGQLEWVVFDRSRFDFRSPKKSTRRPGATRAIEAANAAALRNAKLRQRVQSRQVAVPSKREPRK